MGEFIAGMLVVLVGLALLLFGLGIGFVIGNSCK